MELVTRAVELRVPRRVSRRGRQKAADSGDVDSCFVNRRVIVTLNSAEHRVSLAL
jgi:hypothetical protein